MRKRIYSLNSGFTLVELMITVAIIAILAAVVIPNYTEYVRRGNRAEATAAMLESAAWLQQQYTLRNTYDVGTAGIRSSTRYTVSHAAGSPTVSTFTLQAVPNAGYVDPKCGTFTLDQSGQRSMTGTFTGTVAECWSTR